VSYRPLAFVFGLTLGDYLLWNWSLNANHDVLALVSGLSLPPLALACAWMIALTLIRVVGGTTRRASRATASSRARAAARQAADPSGAPTTSAAGGSDAASASTAAQRSSSGKLAA
jgi:predicted lipid-binding transport protein (Tim44 family)